MALRSAFLLAGQLAPSFAGLVAKHSMVDKSMGGFLV